VVESKSFFDNVYAESDDINLLAQSIAENNHLEAIERSVAALLAFSNRDNEERVETVEEDILSSDELNIFARLRLSNYLKHIIITRDLETFANPLLARVSSRDNAEFVERLSGRMEKHAANIADEIIKDMQLATHYPPLMETDDVSVDDVTGQIQQLISRIQFKRQEIAGMGD